MRSGSGNTIEKPYKYLCHNYGVPENLTFDVSIVQIGNSTLFIKMISKYGTIYHVSIPRRQN